MVQGRRRSRIGSYISGTMDWGPGWVVTTSILDSHEICEDVVGNRMGQNPFYLNRVTKDPVVFNGRTDYGLTLASYPSPWDPYIGHHDVHIGLFKDPTQAIADRHPGEPAVSIPNFLFELKDVPSMLRHAASRARDLHRYWLANRWRVSHAALARYYSSRRPGEDWLNYHFGWRPFFSDLGDILNLDDYVQKRKKRFKNIKGAEFRDSGSLGSHSVGPFVASDVPMGGAWFGANGLVTTLTTRRRWYSARYSIDPIRFTAELDPSVKSDLRSILGASNDLPIIIWEAMPWSWFVDWFANVDGIVSLLGNRQGTKFLDAVVMDHQSTKQNRTITWAPNGVTHKNGSATVETKQRSLFQPTFFRTDAGYNIFRASDLATLASLKVTRASR